MLMMLHYYAYFISQFLMKEFERLYLQYKKIGTTIFKKNNYFGTIIFLTAALV